MRGIDYSKEYNLYFHDTDFKKRAFPSTILNYFGDIATEHSEVLGASMDYYADKGIAWVIFQWEIDIIRFPIYGEKIKVTTCPCDYNKLFAFRIFDIKDEAGQVIIRGKSTWVLIDIEKRKPIRLSEEHLKIFLITDEDEIKTTVEKPKKMLKPSIENQFKIRYSDIDMNFHVNNSKYIDWAMESLGFDILNNYKVNKIKVMYEKEKRYEGYVNCETEIIENNEKIKTLHRIFSDDGISHCQIELDFDVFIA